MRISVIVCTYNRCRDLAKALASGSRITCGKGQQIWTAVKGVTELCLRNRLTADFSAFDARERAGISGRSRPPEPLRQPLLRKLSHNSGAGVYTCAIQETIMEILVKTRQKVGLMSDVSQFRIWCVLAAAILLPAGCRSGGGSMTGINATTQASALTVSTTAAQNGAVIVTLATTIPGATIYYTVDGSTPTTSSTIYEAPFLVASNLTLNAIATASGDTNSTAATQTFTPNIPSGTLVWSDEFNNSTSANAQPNPQAWTYDTGDGGWGNNELEDYCGWNSSISPCNTANPNVYVGTDGYLHIVAEQPSTGVYTSARLKTEGLFSFQYGRLEFRAQVPEAQGFWPANWLLGNSFATAGWPACGEMDVLERVNGAGSPDWNQGSIHGTGFTGSNLGTDTIFPQAKMLPIGTPTA